MRKGYKRCKGLIALASAFVLVALLSISTFAVDSSAATSFDVYVDGTFYLKQDAVVSDYLVLNTVYTVQEGTIAVYSGGDAVHVGKTSVQVTAATSQSYQFKVDASVAGQSGAMVFTGVGAAYDEAEFNSYEGRYLIFRHCLMNSADPLFQLIVNCAASTSSLTFSSATVYANGIVDVIVGGFNGIITGLGSGVADFFQTLFLANDGSGNLSIFAIVSLVFIGIAVAFGIARWIIKKVGQ